MYIFTDGIDFDCPVCKIEASADRASDIRAVNCNDSTEYYVVCPNCGTKIKISANQIPAHMKTYINILNKGIMTYHDWWEKALSYWMALFFSKYSSYVMSLSNFFSGPSSIILFATVWVSWWSCDVNIKFPL